MTTVKGRVPQPGSSRRTLLREWRRESSWLWPTLASVAAWLIAGLLMDHSPAFVGRDHLISTNIDDTRALLGTIATAIVALSVWSSPSHWWRSRWRAPSSLHAYCAHSSASR